MKIYGKKAVIIFTRAGASIAATDDTTATWKYRSARLRRRLSQYGASPEYVKIHATTPYTGYH